MTEKTTVTGLIATTPRHLVTADGLAITSFRLACSTRRFDINLNRWVDGETNWYTITSFRTLANNASQSLNKGDRIMVTGTLRVRDWDNGERSGTSVEIEADAIGHDISWGTSVFTRTVLTLQDNSAPIETPVMTPAGTHSGTFFSPREAVGDSEEVEEYYECNCEPRCRRERNAG